jgi:hypothetical protein
MEGRRLGEGGSSSRRMGNTGARQFGTAGEEENAEGDRIGGGSCAVVLVLLDAEGIVGRRASSIDWGIEGFCRDGRVSVSGFSNLEASPVDASHGPQVRPFWRPII